MQYLSYRNLGEPGGPEFSEQEVKAIAASFEIEDGPDLSLIHISEPVLTGGAEPSLARKVNDKV